jgi:hypothetical protein
MPKPSRKSAEGFDLDALGSIMRDTSIAVAAEARLVTASSTKLQLDWVRTAGVSGGNSRCAAASYDSLE